MTVNNPTLLDLMNASCKVEWPGKHMTSLEGDGAFIRVGCGPLGGDLGTFPCTEEGLIEAQAERLKLEADLKSGKAFE